jgi:FixJ family two-component response regulator
MENVTPRGLVHIIDDDAIFRRAVARALSTAGLEIQEYEGIAAYLDGVASLRTSCILLDMFMPDATAFELLEKLPESDYPPPVILLTACGDLANTVNTMKAGAVDYLLKPVEMTRLLNSVHRAFRLDEERQAARTMKERVRRQFSSLGDVERNVFVGISNGRINKQLSLELHVCERTIKSVRAEVMVKMEADSIPSLVRYARLLGLIEAPRARRDAVVVSPHTGSRTETRSAY